MGDRGGAYHARPGPSAACLVALAGLLGPGCVRAMDLELPPAAPDTGTRILAFLDARGAEPRAAYLLPLDVASASRGLAAPFAWNLRDGSPLALLDYPSPPERLGLTVAPDLDASPAEAATAIDLVPAEGDFRALPTAAAGWTTTLAGASPTWRAASPDKLPAIRVAAPRSEDCAAQRGCFDDARTCVIPCPDPSPVATPVEPVAPRLPAETSCPAGWGPSTPGALGASVCEPAVLAAICPPEQSAFLGEAGCRLVGSACPSGDFAPPPGGRALRYVRPSVADDGDGTALRPYRTIARALADAAPGTTVMLASEPFDEAIALDGLVDVELRGACVSGTVLRGDPARRSEAVISAVGSAQVLIANLRLTPPAEAAAVTTATGTVRLEELWIEGGRAGVEGRAGAVTTLSRVVVRGLNTANGRAVVAAESGEVRASDLTIEGGAVGVRLSGRGRPGGGARGGCDRDPGRVQLVRTLIRDVSEVALDLDGRDNTVTACELLVERAGLVGARAGSGARLALERAVIRDGGPNVATAAVGAGVSLGEASGAVLERSILDHNAARNLIVGITASATVSRSLLLRAPGIEDAASVYVVGGSVQLVESALEGFLGPALAAPGSAVSLVDVGLQRCSGADACPCATKTCGVVVFQGALTVARLLAIDLPGRIIDASGTSTLALSDLDLRGPGLPAADGEATAAVHLVNTGPTTVRRLRARGLASGGLNINYPRSVVTASDLYFEANDGSGLLVRDGASLVAERVEIRDAVGPAVAIVGAVVPPFTEATLSDLRVDGVTERDYPPAAGIAAVLRFFASVTRFRVAHAQSRAVFVGQDNLLLTDGAIDGSPVGIEVLGETDAVPLLRRVRIGDDVELPFSRLE